MKEEQRVKLNTIKGKLSQYYVSVSKQDKYYPSEKDAMVAILKKATENVLKLKHVDEKLSKTIDEFTLLMESKVGVFVAESLSGHDLYFSAIKDLTNDELIQVLKFDKKVEEKLEVQEGKEYYDKHYNFEAGV